MRLKITVMMPMRFGCYWKSLYTDILNKHELVTEDQELGGRAKERTLLIQSTKSETLIGQIQ